MNKLEEWWKTSNQIRIRVALGFYVFVIFRVPNFPYFCLQMMGLDHFVMVVVKRNHFGLFLKFLALFISHLT